MIKLELVVNMGKMVTWLMPIPCEEMDTQKRSKLNEVFVGLQFLDVEEELRRVFLHVGDG